MRRLLVTGGAGFIGSHFVEHCIARGLVSRIVVLDALTYAGQSSNLEPVLESPLARVVVGDICNCEVVEKLLREESLDGIVNFAAETSVDRSISGPAIFQRSNVEGVVSLLEAARRTWCAGSGVEHRFHQISTDEVFGAGPLDGAVRDESGAYSPGSPYSATKAAADHLVAAWRNTYGLQVSISYSSNVYGPRQQTEKLIPMAIECLLADRAVPLYGDGGQCRNWIFVADLCRALELFLSGTTEGRRLYLGGDREISNIQLLEMLARIAGRDPRGSLQRTADRPGHDRRYGLSSAAFRQLSGFSERTALEQGLLETFHWYKERRASRAARG